MWSGRPGAVRGRDEEARRCESGKVRRAKTTPPAFFPSDLLPFTLCASFDDAQGRSGVPARDIIFSVKMVDLGDGGTQAACLGRGCKTKPICVCRRVTMVSRLPGGPHVKQSQLARGCLGRHVLGRKRGGRRLPPECVLNKRSQFPRCQARPGRECKTKPIWAHRPGGGGDRRPWEAKMRNKANSCGAAMKGK